MFNHIKSYVFKCLVTLKLHLKPITTKLWHTLNLVEIRNDLILRYLYIQEAVSWFFRQVRSILIHILFINKLIYGATTALLKKKLRALQNFTLTVCDILKSLINSVDNYRYARWNNRVPTKLNIADQILLADGRFIFKGIALTTLITIMFANEYTTLESALVLSAGITTAVSLATITGRQTKNTVLIGSIYTMFLFLTFYFIGTTSLFTFFIVYELFLLPSTLLVWLFSPNKRGVMTCLFFIIWTQMGSVLVLIGICLSRSNSGDLFLYKTAGDLDVFISGQLAILIGFLSKIPTFPFYFWLVKTHVEVVTSFSIFLSGFLVKIAFFGLYKLMFMLGIHVKFIAIALAMTGSALSSVLFIFQLDLKKVVAYATIQEMGQLTVALFIFQSMNMRTISMFLITHTLLSIIFFYIVDIVYRHNSSRSSLVVTGLLSSSPKLATTIVISLVLFRGLPFSSKNAVELNLMDMLFSIDTLIGVFWLVMVVMVGNITISYVFLRTLVFSTNQKKILPDLNLREVYLFALIHAVLVVGPFLFF